jgi:hypothetical protein
VDENSVPAILTIFLIANQFLVGWNLRNVDQIPESIALSMFVVVQAEEILCITINRGWIYSCLYINKGSAPSEKVIQDDYLKEICSPGSYRSFISINKSKYRHQLFYKHLKFVSTGCYPTLFQV